MKLDLTPEQIQELKERIKNFDNWQWCQCSECRCDPRSHGVSLDASLDNLIEEVLKDDQDG